MKIKLAIAAALIGIAALATVSLIGADNTPLLVSCSGSMSNNVVNWITNVTGGTAPYTYLWSGNTGVAGNTNNSVTVTYNANGTYITNVLVTDSTSTTATSTCSIVISSFTTPTTTPTTTPPKLHWVNEPTLSIGPKGAFLARGMTVTSVGTNSFQAQVWGITYTVNWSGYLYPKFYFRFGSAATSTANPIEQLSVGDEVGVSGKVDASSPLVVNATAVRNYSTASARPIWNIPHKGESNNNNDNNKNNDNKGESHENKGTTTSSSIQEMNQRLSGLMEQLKNLQEIFKNSFGKK